MKIQEIWKTVPIDDRYEVSNYGRMRKKYKDGIIKGSLQWDGYVKVQLGSKRTTMHEVVMLAFVGPKPEGMETCHKNGVRNDNRLWNLRYDTRAGNQSDRIKHGTHSRGTKHGLNKLTEEQVLDIKARLENGTSTYALAKEYGLSQGTIDNIKKGKSWSWLKPS